MGSDKVLKFIDFEKESKDVKKEHKGKKIKFIKTEIDEEEDPITDFIKQQIQTSILKKELERIGSVSEERGEENEDNEFDEKKTKLKNDNEKTEDGGKSDDTNGDADGSSSTVSVRNVSSPRKQM